MSAKLYIEKARDNEKFLVFIEKNGCEDFPEWRIIVIFHCALHYMKAFLEKNRIRDHNSHSKIDKHINPDSPDCKNIIPRDYYDRYNDLFDAAWNARYTVFYNPDFKAVLLKVKGDIAVKQLKELKDFFKKEGLNI